MPYLPKPTEYAELLNQEFDIVSNLNAMQPLSMMSIHQSTDIMDDSQQMVKMGTGPAEHASSPSIYTKKTTTKMLGDFTVQRVNKEFENF